MALTMAGRLVVAMLLPALLSAMQQAPPAAMSFSVPPNANPEIPYPGQMPLAVRQSLICSSNTTEWRYNATSPPAPIPPLVHMQIHRTASASLSNIVSRLGDRRNMKFMSTPPEARLTLGWPGAFPGLYDAHHSAFGTNYEVVTSFCVYDGAAMRAHMASEPLFLTTMREPGAQAFSAFNSLTDVTWDAHLAQLAGAQPAAGDVWAAQFVNPQAHGMGWYNTVGPTRDHDQDQTRVEPWIASLDGDFARNGQVILAEYFDQGLLLLKRRLNLELREVVGLVVNRSPQYREEPTAERLAQARALNPVDVALYAHFNQTFQAEWAAADGPELRAELQALRSLNSQLDQRCRQEIPRWATCPISFRYDEIAYEQWNMGKESQGCLATNRNR